MLPIGAISEAAYGLRQLLVGHIADFGSDISRIRIGHPGTNLKELETLGENGLNLFFYHVDYDGYPADGTAENPFYVRLYCLVTAVGQELKKNDPANTSGRDISRGENELRLIGEVMRVLHQQPVFSLTDNAHAEVASLQIVPYSVSLDNLNHIWATQGSETPYRLSVAYEMSLAPVPLALPMQTAPLVGTAQTAVWGALERASGQELDGLGTLKPTVDAIDIDTAANDWMPHVCLVEKIGDPGAKLHYVFRVEGDLSAQLDILIAGKAGANLRLYWNLWRRKGDRSALAWQEAVADAVTPVATLAAAVPADSFHPNRLDPQSIDARQVFKVALPAAVALADTRTWQATFYVERDWSHEEPPGSGRTVTSKIRSNPVLLYGSNP